MTEATNNTSALLPCPFCGGTNLEVHGKPGILNAHDDIGCNDCDAFTPEPTWNRRAPPAAAVVMPPSPYMPGVEPESLTDYERGEAQGRCDMWAEVARLNPATDHSEQPLGMVPADHVEHVRAMVVPEGWKLVPIYPTPAMIDVALKWGAKKSEWEELLAAAPTPEQLAKEQD